MLDRWEEINVSPGRQSAIETVHQGRWLKHQPGRASAIQTTNAESRDGVAVDGELGWWVRLGGDE